MNLWVTAEDGAEVCEGGNRSQTRHPPRPPPPRGDGFPSRGLTKPDRALLQFEQECWAGTSATSWNVP